MTRYLIKLTRKFAKYAMLVVYHQQPSLVSMTSHPNAPGWTKRLWCTPISQQLPAPCRASTPIMVMTAPSCRVLLISQRPENRFCYGLCKACSMPLLSPDMRTLWDLGYYTGHHACASDCSATRATIHPPDVNTAST